MGYITVTAATANVRAQANETSTIVAILVKDETVEYSSGNTNYYYLPYYQGYILKSLTVISQGTKTVNDISKEEAEVDPESVEAKYSSLNTTTATNTEKLLTSNLSGIFGIPYQFMSTVDRRLDGTAFGRKYAEKIVGRMPLLFLTPGKQAFMSEFSRKEKSGVLNAVYDGAGDMIDTILHRDGRYYTFEFAYKEYYKYVNPMCNMTAKLLGIGSKQVIIGGASGALQYFDWSKAVNSSFNSYFSAKENVVFYLNSNTSISENFSNETRESSLVSSINGMSDQAKELQFLLGVTAGKEISALNSENFESTMSGIQSTLDSLLSGGGVIKNLSEGMSTVLSGGKLIFPELWADSDFSRSYDVDIKLRSPDCDPVSLYLNIIVPYIHLLAMTAPRQLDSNSYSAPFLVRAFYKGFFNVDMGIITNLSVSKGKEGSWSDNGIPTEVDISLSIKDLYTSMFISSQDDIGEMINNTALMDYLANMVGLNLSEPELTRQLQIYALLKTGSIGKMPNQVWNGFNQDISNLMKKLYRW